MKHRMALQALLASIAGAGASTGTSCGSWDDGTSLVQWKPMAPPGKDTFNLEVRGWLDGYFNIMHSKGDKLLRDCCGMARTHGIDPWTTWGTASDEQQAWWQEKDCNAAVGSPEEDEAMGVPNCDTGTLTSFMPDNPQGLAIHTTKGEGCSLDDRSRLDQLFSDWDAVLDSQPQECASDHIVVEGEVNFTVLEACTQRQLQISDRCTGCYSDFMRNIAGTPTSIGCFNLCFGLGHCAIKELCKKKAKLCGTCIQPALIEHNRCVGGIANKLSIDMILPQMMHFTPA